MQRDARRAQGTLGTLCSVFVLVFPSLLHLSVYITPYAPFFLVVVVVVVADSLHYAHRLGNGQDGLLRLLLIILGALFARKFSSDAASVQFGLLRGVAHAVCGVHLFFSFSSADLGDVLLSADSIINSDLMHSFSSNRLFKDAALRVTRWRHCRHSRCWLLWDSYRERILAVGHQSFTELADTYLAAAGIFGKYLARNLALLFIRTLGLLNEGSFVDSIVCGCLSMALVVMFTRVL